MRIDCPHCGLRTVEEFTIRGDATVNRPALDANADWSPQFNAFLNLRDNPKGRHWELWHHAMGCRRWLVVERSTDRDHSIYSVKDATDARPGGLFTHPEKSATTGEGA